MYVKSVIVMGFMLKISVSDFNSETEVVNDEVLQELTLLSDRHRSNAHVVSSLEIVRKETKGRLYKEAETVWVVYRPPLV